MSGYTYNNINIASITGTILAYLGSYDPSGWVICDGVLRTSTDGRYANLITILSGSGTANSFTPPDYRGAFLRGAINGSTTTYGSLAPVLNASQNHMTETHSHSANSGNQSANHTHTGTTGIQSANHTHTYTTDFEPANHTHTYNDAICAGNSGSSLPGNAYQDNDNTLNAATSRVTGNASTGHTHTGGTTLTLTANHSHSGNSGGQSANHTHSFTTSGVGATHTHPITVSNSTTNNGNETRPYNYGVNWILKL